MTTAIRSIAGRMFTVPGPVAAAFMADRATKVRALLGPVGGGKTVTCIHDLIHNAAMMPVCTDGRIRFRCAAVRDTYDRLEKTTIKTWLEWFPKDMGDWTGGGGRAATHKLTFHVSRGGRQIPIDFEIIFAAIGDQAAEDFMRGFEVTAFWLNEVDRLAEDVLKFATTRTGRFPAMHQLPAGASYRDFIVCDLNAPDTDSWFYRLFEEDRPHGFRLYRQPSGRSPQAENLHNLKPGYYDAMVEANRHDAYFIRRMVDAQYAPSRHGEPVYPMFSDRHLSVVPLKVLPSVPLKLGLDQGLRRPAAIFFQRSSHGQYRIYREVVPGRMSARAFAEQVWNAWRDLAPDHPIDRGWADPAGFIGADTTDGELAWAQTVARELGVKISPAPSQELDLRIGAIVDELKDSVGSDEPALIVDPFGCPLLRKGFVSDYCYKKQLVGSSLRLADKPDKNSPTADPHDALQYGILGDKGRASAIVGRGVRIPGRPSARGNATMKTDIRIFA